MFDIEMNLNKLFLKLPVQKMLLRPPFIKEQDVKSQSSNAITQFQKQHSVKSSSKNKKKQSTIGMRKNNVMPSQSHVQSHANVPNYDSDNGSVHSVNSRKSKGKTKQSTLAIGRKENQYKNLNQNTNFQSKQSHQNQEYEIFKLDSDDDNKSVGSHASKNSRKNTVKENSLGKNRTGKVNVQLNYYYNQKDDKSSSSEEKVHYLEEESKVQTVRLNENVESAVQPLKYNQVLKAAPLTSKNPEVKSRRTEQFHPKPSSSPFQQITLKRHDDELEPVYVLKESEQMPRIQNKGVKNPLLQRVTQAKPTPQNPFSQKNAFVQNTKTNAQFEMQAKQMKIDSQDSSTIQPQMISTKSVTKSVRRNKIFYDNNNSIANSSNVMSSRTNLEGSFQRSRSKSKSKLGDLLKQSRDKKAELVSSKEKDISPKNIFNNNNQSKNQTFAIQNKVSENKVVSNKIIENGKGAVNIIKQSTDTKKLLHIQQSNLISVSILNEQSRVGGQKLGENPVKIQQIQRKSVENQVFDLGQSLQSDLNLSVSHKLAAEPSGFKGDSVHFNFEPQKRKGISITSKQKTNSTAQNKSVDSKKHLDRLMKKCQENEEFLAKSILSNNSQLRESRKPALGNIPSPQLIKKQEKLNRPFERIPQQKVEQEEPIWHNIVKNDPAFQIKQVERKQVKRQSQQQITTSQSPKLQEKKYSGPQIKSDYRNQKPQQTYQQRPMQENLFENTKKIEQQKVNRQQYILSNMEQQNNRKVQKKTRLQRQKQIKENVTIKNTEPSYDYEEQQMQRKNDRNKERNIPTPVQETRNDDRQFLRLQTVSSKVQSSSISHELSLSENGSERSNSQNSRKNKKKQSSLNIMKKHKVQVRDQSPRADQSFYEQNPKPVLEPAPQQKRYNKSPQPQPVYKMQSSQTKVQSGQNRGQYKKPNVINFQQSEEEEPERIKSRTDVNFYNYGEMSQKSMRPPSSKPPLSRKSNASSSKSKSKAKESTLNINVTKKENKMVKNASNGSGQQNQKKKKTLLDIAQEKDYEGSGYGGSDSQCSFNSRQSFGSVNSRGSRKSSTSKKQSTLPITIKNKGSTQPNMRPSLTKIESTTSQVQLYEQSNNQTLYDRLQEQSRKTSREKQRMNEMQRQQRVIVSKDTYFIDERGRLVKQDLIIKGNQVYGSNSQKSAEQMAMDRMRRSREHHRSRSKSRDGGNSRLTKKTSQGSFEDSQYDSSSSGYYNNGSNYNGGSNYGRGQNLYIEQFVKPLEEPSITPKQGFQKPIQNQRKIERQFYQTDSRYSKYQQPEQQQYQEDEEPVRNITLNQLFGRNSKPNNSKPAYSNNQPYQNSYQQNTYQQDDRSKYGGNSKFNGQESRQSNRKKSLSRTEKTFWNR